MRESRTSGSARGARSNPRPYRDLSTRPYAAASRPRWVRRAFLDAEQPIDHGRCPNPSSRAHACGPFQESHGPRPDRPKLCQGHAPNAESDKHHRLLADCTPLQIYLEDLNHGLGDLPIGRLDGFAGASN